VTDVARCIPCPPDPCDRILAAVATEEEQLARILTSLADKAEKVANWLPDTAPELPFEALVDRVRALECVMAQEIAAIAQKERAINAVVRQCLGDQTDNSAVMPSPSPSPPCPPPCPPCPCPCPCVMFHACKLTRRCPFVCPVGFDDC